MNDSQNWPFPAIPINIMIGVDSKSSAMLASFIFVAILLALLIFGFVFKK